MKGYDAVSAIQAQQHLSACASGLQPAVSWTQPAASLTANSTSCWQVILEASKVGVKSMPP
jgi:hypothetical protein